MGQTSAITLIGIGISPLETGISSPGRFQAQLFLPSIRQHMTAIHATKPMNCLLKPCLLTFTLLIGVLGYKPDALGQG